MITLNVNGKPYEVRSDWLAPLLWVLRDELHLTGTKFGCGRGLCGACTVHLNGEAARSCSIMAGEALGKKIVTIEGLSGRVAKAVQDAWIGADVPQCGYCQPGFVMALTSLLEQPDQAGRSANEIAGQITNICRCGTYDAIREAIRSVVAELKKSGERPLSQADSK